MQLQYKQNIYSLLATVVEQMGFQVDYSEFLYFTVKSICPPPHPFSTTQAKAHGCCINFWANNGDNRCNLE